MHNKNQLVFIILCSMLLGCARHNLTAPSSVAVTGGMSRVQSSTTTAEAQRQEMARLNREARIKQARIDNKDIFIDAYKKWKLTHPDQQ
jgi:hypothetical protein